MSAIAQSSAFAPSAGLAGMSRRMPLRAMSPRALRHPGACLLMRTCDARAAAGQGQRRGFLPRARLRAAVVNAFSYSGSPASRVTVCFL